MQVYSEISSRGSGDDEITALTGAKNEHFPRLKKWLYRHVTDIKV